MRYAVLSILTCVLCAATGVAFARGHAASSPVVHVRGHVTKAGTYVAPHVQTAPNATTRDNWSTKGNVNPYTGKEGTKPNKH